MLGIFLSCGVSTQLVLRGSKEFAGQDHYTHYNNYVIFDQSFHLLNSGQDLYQPHPDLYWDLYKYSPTFAALMAPMAILPDLVGLFVWNGLNALLLILALWFIPSISKKARWLTLAIVAIELLTSLQNAQSNGLMAGLIIFTLIFLERRQVLLATLCVALAIFVKPFALVALALFLCYPQRIRAAWSFVLWMILLALLPLVFVSFDQLVFLYGSWFNMMADDHAASYGYSVMGWLQTWFNLDVSKNLVVALGVLLFCIPLLKFRSYSLQSFRYLLLASVLIWVIIFNHKAESPTFVIAMSGVAIWFVSQARSKVNLALLLLAIVFTVLSPSDLFPRFIRKEWFEPFVVKAVPCILIWFKLIYDMLQMSQHDRSLLGEETSL